MRIGIEISQIGNWDFELDGLRLSWGEAHFLERLQLLGRALEKRILLTYIELHDFLSVTRTDILYLYGRLQDPVCRNLRTDIDLTILELGVAEAMAEREQRADAFGVKPAVADVDALFIVDVFPAGVGAECVCRGVFDSYRESERQFSARIDLAEDYIGDGIAGLGTAEPALGDRPYLSYPWHGNRISADETYCEIGVCCGKCFDDCILVVWEAVCDSVGTFAVLMVVLVETAEEEDNVCVCGSSGSICYKLLSST